MMNGTGLGEGIEPVRGTFQKARGQRYVEADGFLEIVGAGKYFEIFLMKCLLLRE